MRNAYAFTVNACDCRGLVECWLVASIGSITAPSHAIGDRSGKFSVYTRLLFMPHRSFGRFNWNIRILHSCSPDRRVTRHRWPQLAVGRFQPGPALPNVSSRGSPSENDTGKGYRPQAIRVAQCQSRRRSCVRFLADNFAKKRTPSIRCIDGDAPPLKRLNLRHDFGIDRESEFLLKPDDGRVRVAEPAFFFRFHQRNRAPQ